MKVNDLYISEYVIDEVGQSIDSFSPHHSDAADKRSVHRSLNEAEDVLNAASVLGLDAVVPLLLVSQRIVTMSLLANDGIHSFLPEDVLLGFIACIKEQVLPFILLFDERFYDI